MFLKSWNVTVYLIVFWVHQILTADKEGLREYCEDETFLAACASDEVVVMLQARYGRMRAGSCISHGSLGCVRDILPQMDAVCSGQRTCQINVRDLLMHSPCSKDFRGFMEAQYQCVKVVTPDLQKCRQRSPVTVATTSGYLSNYVTELTGCGNIDSPWRLLALPGQRYNISLLDFGTASNQKESGVCQVVAIVKDRTAGASETVCSGRDRYHPVYLSTSHDVEVRMVLKSKRDEHGRYVLLKFEVMGCADIVSTPDMWFKRTSQGGVVGCTKRGDTYRLVCESDQWQGMSRNCSDDVNAASSDAITRGFLPLPFGTNITIMVVVATMIGLCVLLGGLIAVRRKFSLCKSSSPENVYFQKADLPADYGQMTGGGRQGDASLAGYPKMMTPSHQQSRTAIMASGYNRNWELQRMPSGPDGRRSPSPTSYRMRMLSSGSPPRYVDHIYESPPSSRKEFDPSTVVVPCSTGSDSLQYFEIDPRITPRRTAEHQQPQCS